MIGSACRFCGAALEYSFCDLGMTPLSNAYVEPGRIHEGEKFYPLHAMVCDRCFLVQLSEFESPEAIFGDYAYFSSYSESWLDHARRYTDMIVERLGLDSSHRVIEVASNDGYLLRNFVERGIPALGVEPAANVAAVAEDAGVPTLVTFFGGATAREIVEKHGAADLLVGNNVLAHVPDLNDFVEGLGIVLANDGVITLEFPHLLRLIQGGQFDTIYHEHFSYFSLLTVERVFAHHRLELFDVEELETHGGSIRVYLRHAARGSDPPADALMELRQHERDAGLDQIDTYRAFEERVRATKRALLDFLVQAKRDGQSVVGYGAAAKGNTLLNYCGIRSDFLDYVVDRSPHKQGRYLPGTRLPIHPPERIAETRPDYVLILPWNLREEIMQQLTSVRDWGARFVIPIPRVEVLL